MFHIPLVITSVETLPSVAYAQMTEMGVYSHPKTESVHL